MIRRLLTILITVLMIVGVLTGCSAISLIENTKPTNVVKNQPVTITMLCSWSYAVAQAFASVVEEKLPHITLEIEPCPIGAVSYDDEVTRRVMHGTESDIFMTTDTDLWDSDKLLNLTDEKFVSRYNLSVMKELSGDGSVYFVPVLSDVLCYLYNADWLREVGLQPPQTLDELDGVFAAMLSEDKKPFIVPFFQTPTQYIKVLISGYLSTPDGQQWMNDYNQGKTTMAQDRQWQQLWKRIEDMAEKGYLNNEDMVFTEIRRILMLQNKNGFMTTIISSQDSNLSSDAKKYLQIMPLLGEKAENKMLYTVPSGYLALSKKLSATENGAKREAALQVMDFISTSEGQQLLCGKKPLAISHLSGTVLPVSDRYSSFAEIIKEGAFTQMPVFENGVEKVLEDQLKGLIEGKITADDAISACDEQNAGYMVEDSAIQPIIGGASKTFPWTYLESRSEELAVVNFCTDSMRNVARTDYAIELGTAFRGEFFKGDITAADVESVIRQDKKIHVVNVTGQQIWDIIEQGVISEYSSWFVAVSGLRYSYQRAVGDTDGKLLEVTSQDGTPLDLQTSYTVAVSENQMTELANVYNFSSIESKIILFTLREAVTKNIKEQGEISPKIDGRIKVITA